MSIRTATVGERILTGDPRVDAGNFEPSHDPDLQFDTNTTTSSRRNSSGRSPQRSNTGRSSRWEERQTRSGEQEWVRVSPEEMNRGMERPTSQPSGENKTEYTDLPLPKKPPKKDDEEKKPRLGLSGRVEKTLTRPVKRFNRHMQMGIDREQRKIERSQGKIKKYKSQRRSARRVTKRSTSTEAIGTAQEKIRKANEGLQRESGKLRRARLQKGWRESAKAGGKQAKREVKKAKENASFAAGSHVADALFNRDKYASNVALVADVAGKTVTSVATTAVTNISYETAKTTIENLSDKLKDKVPGLNVIAPVIDLTRAAFSQGTLGNKIKSVFKTGATLLVTYGITTALNVWMPGSGTATRFAVGFFASTVRNVFTRAFAEPPQMITNERVIEQTRQPSDQK